MMEKDIKHIVERAKNLLNVIRQMDNKESREISNMINLHYSITYVSSKDTFHLYLQDSRFCYILKETDSGMIQIKRATASYKEGKSSIVLILSDYAMGPLVGSRKTEWDITEYKEFIRQYGFAPIYI